MKKRGKTVLLSAQRVIQGAAKAGATAAAIAEVTGINYETVRRIIKGERLAKRCSRGCGRVVRSKKYANCSICRRDRAIQARQQRRRRKSIELG